VRWKSSDPSFKAHSGQEVDSAADPDITLVLARLADLEILTSTIKASIGGDSVIVGGEAHHSPDGLADWVTKNVCPTNNRLTSMVIDIVSLLEQLQDVSKSSDAKLTAKAQARKGGFVTLSLARTITSYSVLIPASFSSGEDDAFGKIKTFKKWSDPRIGFVKAMADKITLWHQGYTSELNLQFPVSRHPVLNTVLGQLANQAKHFYT
jgi:hypothetical protein